jgi:hypothetical protein
MAGLLVLGRTDEVDGNVLQDYAAGWLVKGFFAPIMFHTAFEDVQWFLSADFGQQLLAPCGWFDLPLRILYGVDVVWGGTGYLLTLRLFQTHVRSANPALDGWLVCVVCYAPIWGLIYTNYLGYEDGLTWVYWLSDHPILRTAWGVAILERLTKPIDLLEADDRTSESEEGVVDIGTAFVADGQPSEAVEPGEGALHDPAVATELVAPVHAAPGDARLDAAHVAGAAAAPVVVGLVGMQSGGAAAWPTPPLSDRRHGIEQRLQQSAIVAVGAAQQAGERGSLPVDHNMALRARFAAVRRVRTDRIAPFLAGTAALSRAARLQSMRAAAPSRSSKARCNACQTPAACQSRKRRQQVMPEPQPSSAGSISQGMPDRSTNRMPVSAARSGTRGRPPFGLDRSTGNSGFTTAHSSSGRSSLAMPPSSRRHG